MRRRRRREVERENEPGDHTSGHLELGVVTPLSFI